MLFSCEKLKSLPRNMVIQMWHMANTIENDVLYDNYMWSICNYLIVRGPDSDV